MSENEFINPSISQKFLLYQYDNSEVNLGTIDAGAFCVIAADGGGIAREQASSRSAQRFRQIRRQGFRGRRGTTQCIRGRRP